MRFAGVCEPAAGEAGRRLGDPGGLAAAGVVKGLAARSAELPPELQGDGLFALLLPNTEGPFTAAKGEDVDA